jgi:hypothetical protein
MNRINKKEENGSLCFLRKVTEQIMATGKPVGPNILKRLFCIFVSNANREYIQP